MEALRAEGPSRLGNDFVHHASIAGCASARRLGHQIKFPALILPDAEQLTQACGISRHLDLDFCHLPAWGIGNKEMTIATPPIAEDITAIQFRDRFALIH